jgi:hypothetical protein
MNPSPRSRTAFLAAAGGLGGSALASLAALLASAAAVLAAPPACAAATLPYPQAVERSGIAARAVLARAGRESCLRGKLTNALLGLSNSCEREPSRGELCALADRAAVVTPMSLAFMDETARELLRLIGPGGAGAGGAGARVTGPQSAMAPESTGAEIP